MHCCRSATVWRGHSSRPSCRRFMTTDRMWLLCDLCPNPVFCLLKHAPLSPARRRPSAAEGSPLGGGGLFIAPGSRKMFEPCGVSSLHWGRVGRGDAIHWVAAWPMLKGGGSADVLALRAARLRCWAACAFSPLGTSAPCSSGSWVYWSTSPYPRAHGCFCTSLGHVRSGSVSR